MLAHCVRLRSNLKHPPFRIEIPAEKVVVLLTEGLWAMKWRWLAPKIRYGSLLRPTFFCCRTTPHVTNSRLNHKPL
jgi:hypothetical protein